MQGGAAPAWVTVKTWPWTETVPVREAVEEFGATVNDTVLARAAPPAMAIQLWEVAAVHEQPLAAVTVKLALPPAAGTLAEPGERL